MKTIPAEIIEAGGAKSCELEILENKQLKKQPPALENAIRKVKDLLRQKNLL